MNEAVGKNEVTEDDLTGLEIAIIGQAGRFPGAKNIEEFWQNLKSGIPSITFFSDQELKEQGFGDELLQNPNYVKARGILSEVEYFDHDFFGFSYGEAHLMDPQLRVLHECSWEALECAGYNPAAYKGLIGLYLAGEINLSWLSKFFGNQESFAEQMQALSLNSTGAMSTRVSYNLNLKGPSYTLNTACSSSLVAIHVACQALLNYECEMALAGGVEINLPIKSGYSYQKGMVTSPDGHCRAFDEKAEGTVPGDGCGMVVLKRLETAIKDGDYIYATIKGSAINNDGSRKAGYTAPSIEGQAEVISMAQQMAETPPESISYIEAHGTGTALGDPIEIEGLKLGFNTEEKQYCRMGSVKTNIGHLDIAAGIAGFIKTVLSLHNKLIVPSLHFQKPNPKINFDDSPFLVNNELTPWHHEGYPLRAGVSSFGIGGTNAHVILEEYQGMDTTIVRDHNIITLSAKTELALEQMTSNLLDYLSENKQQNLANIAYTLQVGRKDFAYRRAFVATTIDDAIQKLQALTTYSVTETKNDLVFMFPGQGAQYVNMGKELYESHSLFRAEMDRCFRLLEGDLKAILFANEQDSTKINEIQVIGPLLFTIMYALAKLLISWGITPKTMIGYSLGEYVAACLAGVFSLEDALKIVTIRGKLLSEALAGSMISAPLSEAELQPFLNKELSISVANGDSCIVSGSKEAINDFEERLKKDKLICMRLDNLHIAHSQAVDPILDCFRKELETIALTKPHIKYISSLTGKQVQDEEVTTINYWVRHLRETVRFVGGIQTLLEAGDYTFIEVGPGRDLSMLLGRYVNQRRQIINTMPPKNKVISAEAYLFNQIAKLWSQGLKINWESINQGLKLKRVPLPTYPFAKTSFDISLPISLGGMEVAKEKEKSIILSNETEVLHNRRQQITDYQEPTNEIEKTVVGIMQSIFRIDFMSVDEDFFELGGDSLKATILAGKIHEKLNIEIPVHEIFNHPTAAEIATLIMGTAQSTYTPIDTAPKQEYYPLTPQQKGIFIANTLGNDSTSYNISLSVKITGQISKEKVEEVFNQIIKRHDSLRTGFKTVAGEVVMYVLEEVVFKVDYLEAVEAEYSQIKQAFIRPFDLSLAPLFRASLIKIAEEEHILMLDMHHIVIDGSSMVVIVNDFIGLYGGKELAPLNVQYQDYEHWQRQLRTEGKYQKQEDYWLDVYRDGPPVLNLPTDYPRPAIKSFAGKKHHFHLHKSLTVQLDELASTYQATRYMVLLAAYNILLNRYTAGEDIVVGTPFAGRTHADLQGTVGMFVNTIALRNYPQKEHTIAEFLLQVRDNTLKAYENQDYQFEELVEKLNLRKDRSRSPIFDTMFALQNISINPGKAEIAGMGITVYETAENDTSKFDVTLEVHEGGDGLRCNFEYCTKLFKPETIVRFANHFVKIIEAMVASQDLKISEIDLLSETEKHELIHVFNQAYEPSKLEKTIHEWFEEQVLKAPDKQALVYQQQTLTYQQINEKANQLARVMRQRKLKYNQVAAIMMKRSSEVVVAVLAVLKAGGAFVMIDPDYPMDRINYLLQDSGVRMLVTKLSEYQKTNLEFQHELIDMEDPRLYQGETTNLDHVNRPDDLLYIVYTSGTTGQPKGSMMKHQNIVNLMSFQFKHTTINFQERVMQFAAMSFDVFHQEIFSTLLSGGTLYIIEERKKQVVGEFLADVEKNQINVLFMPTAYFKLIAGIEEYTAKIPACLDHIIVAGEQLIVAERMKKHLRDQEICLHNHYGPVEAHVVTAFVMNPWHPVPSIPPIGKPIANTKIYILGSNDQVQPIGVIGELCIASEALSPGYLNLPQLTEEKFVPHPFIPGERLYRTGDLACWLPDGNIQFYGRRDHQVKIRGFRVEPGEIESRLLELEAVTEAIVIVKEGTVDHDLCAYVVTAEAIPLAELRGYLSAKLPDYMVPSFIMQLPAMPLTANGKVDRKALPEPEAKMGTRLRAPRNQIEETLVRIWSEVLGYEQIGIDHNFFDLGGHSLKATVVIARIHEELNATLPLSELLEAPTIAGISEYLGSVQGSEGSEDLDVANMMQLSSGEAGIIFAFPPAFGYGIAFKDLAKEMEQYTIYGFDFIEKADAIAAYVKLIKLKQPAGPYRLLAYSAGGKLAFAVASALQKQNDLVSELILLDSTLNRTFDVNHFQQTAIRYFETMANHFSDSNHDHLVKKNERYVSFINDLHFKEPLNVNLHLIMSKESSKRYHKYLSKLTNKKVLIHNGFGDHLQMISGENLLANVKIIKKILNLS